MLRYLAFGIALTGLIIGVQLYLKQSDRSDQITASIQTSQSDSDQAGAWALSQASEETIPSPQNNSVLSPTAEVSEVTTPNDSRQTVPAEPFQIWQDGEDTPALPQRFSNKGIDARPLKVAKQQFTRMAVGDKLKIPVPQSSLSYEMSIEQVGRHANGDKSLKGHLTNQPQYAVVVTEGRSSTYATINTPDGSFMLEAQQEQGWLVAANDLDSLIDPNLTDYQIPDINRNTN